mgnify:FL=1
MTGRRKQGFLLFRDVMHVILAIVIIVMVVFAFLSPNKYAIFFPLVFLLFSINCLLDAIKYFKNEERLKYGFIRAVFMFLMFLFMLLMSTIGFLNI